MIPPVMTDMIARYGEWKVRIEMGSGLSPDALHIHVGLVLWLLFSRLFARGMASIWPWLMLLAMELTNEAIDLSLTGGVEANFDASRHDVLNTMLAPTLVMLFSAWRMRGQAQA